MADLLWQITGVRFTRLQQTRGLTGVSREASSIGGLENMTRAAPEADVQSPGEQALWRAATWPIILREPLVRKNACGLLSRAVRAARRTLPAGKIKRVWAEHDSDRVGAFERLPDYMGVSADGKLEWSNVAQEVRFHVTLGKELLLAILAFVSAEELPSTFALSKPDIGPS